MRVICLFLIASLALGSPMAPATTWVSQAPASPFDTQALAIGQTNSNHPFDPLAKGWEISKFSELSETQLKDLAGTRQGFRFVTKVALFALLHMDEDIRGRARSLADRLAGLGARTGKKA